MALSAPEKSWLAAYRKALGKMKRGTIKRLVIFGSKARGDDHPGSDLDMHLIVANEAASLKRKLRRIGYRLAATGEAVPSIIAYTEAEWNSRKSSGSPFFRAVERDKVQVL